MSLIAPEVIVSVAGVIVMMVDAFSRRGQRWVTGALSIIALIAAGMASLWLWAAALSFQRHDCAGRVASEFHAHLCHCLDPNGSDRIGVDRWREAARGRVPLAAIVCDLRHDVDGFSR